MTVPCSNISVSGSRSCRRRSQAVCEDMAQAEDLEALYEKYQQLLDRNEAMDGDNYESNITKISWQSAGMSDLAETKLREISAAESTRLLQIMREMLLAPNLLVLDEPDVFLDFGNLGGLCSADKRDTRGRCW